MKRKDPPRRPEWAPTEEHPEFAARILPGSDVPEPPASGATHPVSRPVLTAADYIEGILAGDRTRLARAITLVESNSPTHMKIARQVVQGLHSRSGNSMRIGITGVPGAGKSTFIETLGVKLCDQGHRVAVLAVDPSSVVSGGSILGDKTRMEELARREEAYIRPSPTGGTLGGVTRKSRETILLLEAAGFDVILIETVGVGQSEVTVRSMVDFFLLLLVPFGGDELQGIKKGVVELADALFVNKAEGENRARAELAQSEYNRALHYLQPATTGHTTRCLLGSALSGEGIDDLWSFILEFFQRGQENNSLETRRARQRLEWLDALVEQQLVNRFYAQPEVADRLDTLREEVEKGIMSPTDAALELLSLG